MESEDIILSEQRGSRGELLNYYKNDEEKIQIENSTNTSTSLIWSKIWLFLRDLLLPYGYPDSVSNDYYDYQFWDTIQAFCSTITGIFTTQAVLKGFGVGDASASTLSATITWILKDGTGMCGRILFAWWKGNVLDAYCKRWRLFADVINDAAMLLELGMPFVRGLSTPILCVSTTMKAIVGVAGGSTRASITQHQAVQGNLAEIAAKDGSQETLVNLLASFVGIFLLKWFHIENTEWIIVVPLIILHLYANYRAVKALIIDTFNKARLNIVLKNYLVSNAILSPVRVNQKETVFLWSGTREREFCGFDIIMGRSLKHVLKSYDCKDLKNIVSVYENRKYLIVVDILNSKINVAFESGETINDIISAYFHAVLLGIATCIYNDISIDVYSKRQLHYSSPITRLITFTKSYVHNENSNATNIPIRMLRPLNDFIVQEIKMFFVATEISGWKTTSHSLEVDEWRMQLTCFNNTKKDL